MVNKEATNLCEKRKTPQDMKDMKNDPNRDKFVFLLANRYQFEYDFYLSCEFRYFKEKE